MDQRRRPSAGDRTIARLLPFNQRLARFKTEAALWRGVVGESAGALLNAIRPWLAEARTRSVGRLRHGPDGAAAMDQRSCMVAPLALADGMAAFLYVDIDGRYGRFDDGDCQLLDLLASQVAFAMRMARQRCETREAQERQAATADILKVIAASADDVPPVFDAIVATAVRLLDCDLAFVQRCEGARYYPVAGAGPDGPVAIPGDSSFPIDPLANFPSQAIARKQRLHVPDGWAIELPPHERQRREQLGINAGLYLPLMRADNCIGLLVFKGKSAAVPVFAVKAQAQR